VEEGASGKKKKKKKGVLQSNKANTKLKNSYIYQIRNTQISHDTYFTNHITTPTNNLPTSMENSPS